jgi:hypothetical protein
MAVSRDKNPYLVVYDYGTGGLWGLLRARSKDEIATKYPELSILDQRPDWMTADRFDELKGDPYDIDAPPRGMLRAVTADRQRM